MKRYLYLLLLSLASLLLSLWLVGQSYTTTIVEPDITQELKAKADSAYLNRKIAQALQAKAYDEAKIYLDIAHLVGQPIDQSLIIAYRQEQTLFAKSRREITAFWEGFVSGKGKDMAGLTGSVVSDFTLVGDLRDIYHEGSRYAQGEAYDRLVLGISLVGVALSASTLLSVGATAPLKTATSLLKGAYKSGKITKGFAKVLDKKVAKSVDYGALKAIDFHSIEGVKGSLKQLRSSIDPVPMRQLLTQLGRLKKNTSTGDTIALLKYVENEKDLSKVVKLSRKYGKETRGVLKVLGKAALRGGKRVVKLTKALIGALVGVVVSLLSTLFSLVVLYRLWNKKEG